MRRLVPVVKAVRMSESVLQLSEQEVTRALAEIDAPELVAAELTGRGCGTVELGDSDEQHTVVRAPASGKMCVLPTDCLRMIRTAALAALAARALQSPGILTTAVIGAAASVRVQLNMLARHV